MAEAKPIRAAGRPSRTPASPLTAYLLHRWDWSESSLILDLLTREQGRIVVLAKGAKRPYSQLRAVLLSFQAMQVTLGRMPAESELQVLRSAERLAGASMPSGEALFSGFYMNELLIKLVARHDPHPRLFDAYACALAALAQAPKGADKEGCLRAFEWALLQELGWLPDLSVVTSTQQELRPELRYELLPDVGVTLAREPATSLAAQNLIHIQAALLHGSFDALRHACQFELPILKTMLRRLLQHHLGSSALQTREVLLSLQRVSAVRCLHKPAQATSLS
jgi:DNA repair protein RecO (recombination protein O)